MLVVGFAISGSGGWRGIAGNILVAVGGVFISWSAATSFAAERALGEQHAKLDGLSRQLGTVSGQIGHAVGQGETGNVEPVTAFAMIGQLTRTLYGLVNE